MSYHKLYKKLPKQLPPLCRARVATEAVEATKSAAAVLAALTARLDERVAALLQSVKAAGGWRTMAARRNYKYSGSAFC